jgi:hypothetical protein
MPEVGFEPTIPVIKREKTVHALDCVAIVIGDYVLIPFVLRNQTHYKQIFN